MSRGACPRSAPWPGDMAAVGCVVSGWSAGRLDAVINKNSKNNAGQLTSHDRLTLNEDLTLCVCSSLELHSELFLRQLCTKICGSSGGRGEGLEDPGDCSSLHRPPSPLACSPAPVQSHTILSTSNPKTSPDTPHYARVPWVRRVSASASGHAVVGIIDIGADKRKNNS